MDTSTKEFKDALYDHARSLGVDPISEPQLLPLVQEALLAQLPPDWEQGEADDGTLYYFNEVTGQSTWEHPLDDYYRKLIENAARLDEDATSPVELHDLEGKDFDSFTDLPEIQSSGNLIDVAPATTGFGRDISWLMDVDDEDEAPSITHKSTITATSKSVISSNAGRKSVTEVFMPIINTPSTSPLSPAIVQDDIRLKQIAQDNNALAMEVERLRKDLDQAQRESKQTTYYKMKASDAKYQIEKLETNMQTLNDKLSEHDKRSQQMEGKNASSDSEAQRLRSIIESLQSENKAFTRVIDDIKEEREDLKNQLRMDTMNWKAQVSKAECQILSLESKVQELQAQLSQIKVNEANDQEAWELKLDAAYTRCEDLDVQLRNAVQHTNALQDLQARYDKEEKAFKASQASNVELLQKVSDLHRQLQDACSIRDTHSARIAQLLQDKEAFAPEIIDLSAQNKRLKAEIASCQSNALRYEAQIQDLQQELAHAQIEKRKVQDEVAHLQTLHHQLEIQHRQVQEAHHLETSKWQADLLQAESQARDAYKARSSRLTERCKQLKIDHEAAEDSLERCSIQNNELKQALSAQSLQNHELLSGLKTLKKEHTELAREKELLMQDKYNLTSATQTLQLETSALKQDKQMEKDRTSCRIRELESLLSQKEYDLARLEESNRKIESWRAMEAKRGDEKDTEILKLQDDLAQLRQRNVEDEQQTAMFSLKQKLLQAQCECEKLRNDKSNAESVLEQQQKIAHEERQHMEQVFAWQIPQLANACVARVTEEWSRRSQEMVKAAKLASEEQASKAYNILLQKVNEAEQRENEVRQKLKSVMAEFEQARVNAKRSEETIQKLVEQLSTARRRMQDLKSPEIPKPRIERGYDVYADLNLAAPAPMPYNFPAPNLLDQRAQRQTFLDSKQYSSQNDLLFAVQPVNSDQLLRQGEDLLRSLEAIGPVVCTQSCEVPKERSVHMKTQKLNEMPEDQALELQADTLWYRRNYWQSKYK